MDYEFNRMLEDACNLSKVVRDCILTKLDNDIVENNTKEALIEDCSMLYSIMDSIVEKLDLLLSEPIVQVDDCR